MAHNEHTTLHTISRRSPFGALFSRTLPRYTGPHPVGVCDIEVPVQRQTFGNFTHKRFRGEGTAGLTMETVLFSLFYPAVEGTGTSAQVVWFPNLQQTIDGFLRMASRTPNFLYRMIAYPLAAAAIWGTTFPAHENAKLKRPPPATGADGAAAPGSWPLVIFSHGVGCSRLMYSAICGELASRGYIVAALEHRDGTGPASTIRGPDGKTRFLDFINHRDLRWPDLEEQPPDDTTLRHVQLDLRLAETSALLSVMDSITRGVSIENYAVTAPHWDWSRWRGAVKLDGAKGEGVVMSGHSLGASLALAAAADKRFAFAKVMAMDPAVQRLEPWRGQVSCPLIVVNSEEFAVAPDFMRLDRLADTALDPLIFNIAGSTHPSFSDVHLILPGFVNRRIGLSCSPELILAHTVSTVAAFLAGADPDLVAARAEGYTTAGGDGAGPTRPIGKPGKLLQWIHTHRPRIPIHAPGPGLGLGLGLGLGHHEPAYERRSKSSDRKATRRSLLEPLKRGSVEVTRIELGFRSRPSDEAGAPASAVDVKGLQRAGSISSAPKSPPLHDGGDLLL